MPPDDPKLRLLVRHSDSPKDRALAEELLGHLRPLQRFANLDVWSDARLRAGDETRREIERTIDQAEVVLLLLSADFFASDTLLDVEVPKLMERHRQGSLKVIPVLLRSCLWDAHPWLAELHPLPRDGKPIASHQGDERDRVLTELVKEISGIPGPSAVSAARAEPGPALTEGSSDTWILVAGTGIEPIAQHQRWVAEKLGETLARNGFGLVTGGWPGVDLCVLNSFVQASSRSPDVSVVQVVPRGTPPMRAIGCIIEVPHDLSEWIEALNRADAVVLIGGLGRTFGTYEYARKRQIPVIPIPGTGGDARAVFDAMLAQNSIHEDFVKLDVAIEVASDSNRAVRHAMQVLGRELQLSASARGMPQSRMANHVFSKDVGRASTYNIHIHGSTIGGLGVGPGANITGSINAGQVGTDGGVVRGAAATAPPSAATAATSNERQRKQEPLLPLVINGTQLTDVIAGAPAIDVSNEHCSTDEDVDLVGGLLQICTDFVDVWRDMGIQQRIEVARSLSEGIDDLAAKGWLVFAGRSKGVFESLSGQRTRMSAAHIRVVRVGSQEIISVPEGRAVRQGVAPESPKGPNMASVYLSYSDEDLPAARRLYEALEVAEVPVFFRVEHATLGSKHHRSARKNIREYEHVILLCSERSLNAPSVMSELDEMLSREFDDGASERIIPVLFDDYAFEGWAPRHPDIRRAVLDRVPLDMKGADADRTKFEKAIKRLLGALKG